MHIDVTSILNEDEGTRSDFTITGEEPQIEDVTLTKPIDGQIQILRTKEGLLVTGRLESDVELVCGRCLRTFSHHVEFPLGHEFSLHPGEDEFLIDRQGRIDLSEPIRQEIEVSLPLSPLCQADCEGIELKHKKD